MLNSVGCCIIALALIDCCVIALALIDCCIIALPLIDCCIIALALIDCYAITRISFLTSLLQHGGCLLLPAGRLCRLAHHPSQTLFSTHALGFCFQYQLAVLVYHFLGGLRPQWDQC